MMDEIVPPRKRGAQKSEMVLRICNIGRPARNRIEQGKQEKTCHKSADMRFPGDVGALHADPNRSNAEDEIDAKPDDEEGNHAAITQRLPEGLRGYLGGTVRIASAEREEAAPHEREADAGCHGAGNGGGSADHRREFMFMREEMRGCAGRRRNGHEGKETHCAE